VPGTAEIASTTYPDFARDVKPGDAVLLADGALQLQVLETNGIAARCRVVSGGMISDRKGINLPGVQVSTPSLSKKDVADAHFGVEHGVDFLALSFVRQARDVLRLRHLLEEVDAKQPIIAKIEKPEGWQNLDSILEECDGVMVARGDLGVEMALEKVPAIQKTIIEKARLRGRFVITATQMLESMIENPLPTRAEVSDVANAIHDGTSAIMLSAETSAGKHPIEAVRDDGAHRLRNGIIHTAARFSRSLGDLARALDAGDYCRCRVSLRANRGRGGAGRRHNLWCFRALAGALPASRAHLRVHFQRSRGPAALHHLRGGCSDHH
jgi:pyruvate kinase